MNSDYVPVNRPLITQEDTEYVLKALGAGWVSGDGPYVEEFESNFSKLIGRNHGVAVANGSVALDIVIEMLDLVPGDEIILPSFTIISCLSQILRTGATPVFVDANSDDWNMNLLDLEAKISNRTRAVLAVHIYGLPVDMVELIKLGERYSIPIIEDAAEAHGLVINERMAGSYGVISTFSFYANKNITTGEGGMILTDDVSLAEKARSLRNLGFQKNRRFVHDVAAWNARLTSMQAALGTSQSKRLDAIVDQRIQLGDRYSEAFSKIKNIQLPLKENKHARNNYWVFGIVLDKEHGLTAIDAMRMLDEIGVGCRPFFYPLHLQPVLSKYNFSNQEPLPVAEHLGEMGFYIPNGLGITESETTKVIDAVRRVLG
jgi:perosamine synthetase